MEFESLNTEYKREYTEDNEKKIIALFKAQGQLKRKDIEKTLCISQTMAVQYLKSLINKAVIKKVGNGKNIVYLYNGK